MREWMKENDVVLIAIGGVILFLLFIFSITSAATLVKLPVGKADTVVTMTERVTDSIRSWTQIGDTRKERVVIYAPGSETLMIPCTTIYVAVIPDLDSIRMIGDEPVLYYTTPRHECKKPFHHNLVNRDLFCTHPGCAPEPEADTLWFQGRCDDYPCYIHNHCQPDSAIGPFKRGYKCKPEPEPCPPGCPGYAKGWHEGWNAARDIKDWRK